MPETRMSSVEGYLRGLASACREASREPQVRALLLRLLLIAPSTILELRRVERLARRLAA